MKNIVLALLLVLGFSGQALAVPPVCDPSDRIPFYGNLVDQGGGWRVYDLDSNHSYYNVDSVSTVSGSSTSGYVQVFHPCGTYIGTPGLQEDNAYASANILYGASIDNCWFKITFAQNGSPISPNTAGAVSNSNIPFDGWTCGPEVSPPTTYQGVSFDGSDYMTRGADLTGNADGKKGTVSLWFKMNGGNGTAQAFFRAAGGYFAVNRNSINGISIAAFNSSGTQILGMDSTTTYTNSSGWHHLHGTWDLSATTGTLKVDGSSVLDTATDIYVNDNIDYTRTNWAFGALENGTFKANADFAEVYLNTVADVTTTSVFASGGSPVDLGANCATPSGSSPILCFKGPATGFNTNLGTGGNFTVTGTLTNSSTNP